MSGKWTLLFGAGLITAAAAWAQSPDKAGTVPTDRLAERYQSLTDGSPSNAQLLVTGLRDGTDIKLGSTTIDPPTGKMGYGEVNIALALAKASLDKQGITSPTADQLNAALTGTNGVLTQRAAGQGWGQIANAMGFRLGELVRSPKANEATERVARNRMERADKPDRPDRVDRPSRPDRPDKPDRPGR